MDLNETIDTSKHPTVGQTEPEPEPAPDCRRCGHPPDEHEEQIGPCTHVHDGAAIIGVADIVCSCWKYMAPPEWGWVVEIFSEERWYPAVLGRWRTLAQAEEAAIRSGLPYTVRRQNAPEAEAVRQRGSEETV